ncbi:RES family NAD+ phosphorylase [Bradyrhizobium sp.]|uniref:RES family NAD+ phosphorylase n=1 Tax=Bradyrhizobium sp. TaxID=376 RepID=UPI0040378D56
MSSNTWTAGALLSRSAPLSGSFWRIVEAQHHVSTMKLTDSLEEQAILEDLIEETKPLIPTDCAGLHFLLMTPFRYSRQNPWGSRFRRPNADAGVFYAAEHPETAIAETVFHRLRFFAESPETPWPKNAAEYTAFSVEVHSERALDLTAFAVGEVVGILDPADYSAGQALSERAREAGIELIKYPSVRDPDRGANLAVLTPAAFATREPTGRQTWRIYLDGNGARAICESPNTSLAFGRDAFDADPRMSGFAWER